MYQSCQKFQIFDILRVSLAENSHIKTNPYKMVAQTARPHSGRADVIIRVVEIVKWNGHTWSSLKHFFPLLQASAIFVTSGFMLPTSIYF